MQAKPFLKWAGGKGRLISDIEKLFPNDFDSQVITYVEPFVGGGAVLFWVLYRFPQIQNIIINDINSDLMNTYKIISEMPEKLIIRLQEIQEEFYSFEFDIEGRKAYYANKRNLFNSRVSNDLHQAALFIFLNRTCFNGLYRVNKKNEFNVPIGSYVRPLICDSENILEVSKVLKRVKILNGDYTKTIEHAENKTLFYLDPPYKPLNKTSNFNSYSNNEFNDKEQIRLRDFCILLDKCGSHWILSNSDVKVIDSEDSFFDELYSDYEINRVKVKRFINNNSKRKHLNELLIVNKVEEVVLVHN